MKSNNNGFTKTSVESETTGSALKRMRSLKNITLEELSAATKIQIKYLKWIEEDNYQKLPSQVYIEGFLKSCAKFLGEDPKETIKLFRKEQEIRKSIGNKNANFKKIKPINEKPIIISSRTIIIGISLLLALGACFYVYKQASFIAAPPSIEILSPPQDIEVFNDAIDVIGKSSEGSQVSINSQQVYADESGSFQEKIYLRKGLNVISISSVNRVGKKTEVVRNVIYTEK